MIDHKQAVRADLDNRFDYHAPTEASRDDHQTIRQEIKAFAALVLDTIPTSRESALFLTHLEQAGFWAHAAIARNQDEH